MQPAPECETSSDLLGCFGSEDEDSAIGRLTQEIHTIACAQLGMLLLHFTARRKTRGFPFVEIELAVVIRVETLEELRLVSFPVGEQLGRILVGVEFELRTSGRAELTDGIQHAVRQ